MKLILGLAVIGLALALFLRSFWNPPSQIMDGSERSNPRTFGGTWPNPDPDKDKGA